MQLIIEKQRDYRVFVKLDSSHKYHHSQFLRLTSVDDRSAHARKLFGSFGESLLGQVQTNAP